MAYVWQRWLADEYRKAGLKVVEIDGWKNRGRPASTGNFDPRGAKTNHHTGTKTSATNKAPTLRTVIEGRSDLPGPLAQKVIGFDGTVYVVAAGRCNHAGKVGKRGVTGMPYGADGNALALGDEVDTNGTQVLNKEQRAALAKVNAVDLMHFDRGTSYAHRHQDISGTGKWDIGSLTTAQVRADAAAAIKALSTPPPPPVTTHTRWATRATGVHATPGGKKLRDIPAGYKFQVIDDSGHGNDGWVETSAGNWVVSADTTTRDPALLSRLSVSTHNVWNARDWEDDVLPTINAILPKHQIDVPNFQECYRAPDLRGKVPGYTFRNQGYGYDPETPGYIEERSDNVILVRDGVDVKVHGADQMTESWAGPKMGAMHDPRVFRRVTVNKDQQNFRVINVHGPFGTAARQEFLTWAREEFEELAALGDPVIFIGDWNVDFETLKKAIGPLATIDGGKPDMVAYANCRKHSSVNLGRQGSDTHNFKIWVFEA